MSEITKLYENAGLSNMWVEEYDDKQFWHGSYIEMIQSMMKLNNWDRKTATSVAHKECRKALPPFTAEKQLRIMELLVRKGMLLFTFLTQGNYKVSGFCRGSNYCSDINEAFANYINSLWQDLTEEDKTSIKNILEM